MACIVGGNPDDMLPQSEESAEQIAADQKKLAAALTAAFGPPINPTR